MQTVLIADDHPLFREAIRDVVGRLFAAKGWEFACLEATSFEEALGVVEDAAADLDLILLDLFMPGTRDLSGLVALRAKVPATPIVVVSSLNDSDAVRRAMTCGAAGFIPKSSPKELIVNALQLVLAGGIYLPREILGEAPPPKLHRGAGLPDDALGDPLTPRQVAVLARLAEGRSNKEIARDLAISDMTVKAHVTAILRSLGVATRAQAIVAYRRERSEGEERMS
jgi:DNA-binding NarL/FixJ family response regulator